MPTKAKTTSKASVKTQKPSAKKKTVSNFPKSKSGSAVNNAKLTQEQILAIKKSQFVDEVAKMKGIPKQPDYNEYLNRIIKSLPEEQRNIFIAFVTASKKKKIAVTDCKGKDLIISIAPKNEAGKILIKHYNSQNGTVKASEILRMFDIVRTGNKSYSQGNTVYSIIKKKNNETYKTVVKIYSNGTDAVLKSFHSTIGY